MDLETLVLKPAIALHSRVDILERFLGHDHWTTNQLIEQSKVLTQQQLEHRFDLGHGTVLATLEHIVDNMETWVDLMNGGQFRTLADPQQRWSTLAGLQSRLDVAAAELATLAMRVQREQRSDDLWTDVLDKPPTQKSFGGAIVHIITHSMHHRAQLIHMLKRLGVQDVLEGDALGWERTVVGDPSSSPRLV